MAYERTEIRKPHGINKDLSPQELPMDQWSDGKNIRFFRQRVSTGVGFSNKNNSGFSEGTDYVISPIFAFPLTDREEVQPYQWIYASEDQIYKTAAEPNHVISNLSRNAGLLPYNATRESNWTGCNFNGIVVMNNKTDEPQQLNPDTGEMEELTNWDTGVAPWRSGYQDPVLATNSRCRVIRPYKNYLLALDCTDEEGNKYPSMVRWSSPAQAGDVPPSWDPTKTGEQAGLYTLADTPGELVDGMSLGDNFVLYKTDSVWLMQFIGGDFVFSFRKLFEDDAGCLSTDCVAEFEGKHFVMGPTGAYVHNGSTRTQVMEGWVRDYFADNVDPERLLETRVVPDHFANEMWVYFVGATGLWYTDALVWDWVNNSWTVRKLDVNISYIQQGNVTKSAGDNGPWTAETENWNERGGQWETNVVNNKSVVRESLVFTDVIFNTLYSFIPETEFPVNGPVPMASYVERLALDFEDDWQYKYITRIVPHFYETSDQTPIKITLYASDEFTETPDVAEEYTYVVGEDTSADFHVAGRYIGIRFEGVEEESETEIYYKPWTLTGYTIHWERAGEH